MIAFTLALKILALINLGLAARAAKRRDWFWSIMYAGLFLMLCLDVIGINLR